MTVEEEKGGSAFSSLSNDGRYRDIAWFRAGSKHTEREEIRAGIPHLPEI